MYVAGGPCGDQRRAGLRPGRLATRLPDEGDAIEQAGLVVGDDQAAVGRDHDAGGAAPTVSVGALPAGQEVARDDRLVSVEVDAKQLRRGRWVTVPRAVLHHEQVVGVIGRERLPGIERKPE